MNSSKYCSDVYIEHKWYRYFDNKDFIINIIEEDLKKNEPQMLIYELEEGNNYINQF